MFKIYDEPHRSGVFKVYDSRKACLKIYDEPASPNRGAESPNEGHVYLYMISRNRAMGGVFKIYDEPHRSGVFKVYESRKAFFKNI